MCVSHGFPRPSPSRLRQLSATYMLNLLCFVGLRSDGGHKQSVLQGLWSSECLDKMNQTLQHADELGKAMLDAVYSKGTVYEAEAR